MLTSKFVKPVTLPDGHAKFVTTPLITGSLNNTNTIGIVLRRPLQRQRGRCAADQYYLGRTRNHCRGLRVKILAVPDRVVIVDVDVATDRPTKFLKCANNGRVAALRVRIALG